MRLKITHTTEYSYAEPVSYSLQRLRLTPFSQPGQTVLNWETSVEGAKVEVGYEDHFANRVTLVSVMGDQIRMRIVATGEVETQDRAGVFGPHQSYIPLWLFQRDTPLTKRTKQIRDLAKSQGGDGVLAQMHDLMGAIHEAVTFEPGSTGTETTADEALTRGIGVCQDHAHIFIASARSLGLPARYVSGYLMMDDRTEQSATHAWAEAHLPGLGWVGFDAANDVCPDERYVRIATGLDYRDAAPISGLVHGAANETLTVALTVEQQGQSQSQSQS
ncbi:transglutaminase [Rhizobium sp. Leaf371]|uniref:transglutaminase family protein n=2 Tax=unclassified Rhizobium TaxID=2613769 RepID=UPI0007143E61|nr:transglutaminase family protein [Rhizobium sp. Leaf371]KQS72450.1 transglutaminase [Rhizobium sp. Leaf371]